MFLLFLFLVLKSGVLYREIMIGSENACLVQTSYNCLFLRLVSDINLADRWRVVDHALSHCFVSLGKPDLFARASPRAARAVGQLTSLCDGPSSPRQRLALPTTRPACEPSQTQTAPENKRHRYAICELPPSASPQPFHRSSSFMPPLS